MIVALCNLVAGWWLTPQDLVFLEFDGQIHHHYIFPASNRDASWDSKAAGSQTIYSWWHEIWCDMISQILERKGNIHIFVPGVTCFFQSWTFKRCKAFQEHLEVGAIYQSILSRILAPINWLGVLFFQYKNCRCLIQALGSKSSASPPQKRTSQKGTDQFSRKKHKNSGRWCIGRSYTLF